MQWAHFKAKLQAVDPDAQALKEEPLLTHVESYYMKAFTDLSRSRPMGMGIGAISITDVLSYCTLFNIAGTSERADLLYLIGEMDDEFLTYYNNKK